jgi:3-oxoacyl-[acyl-carrier protein] reductase
MDLDLKGKVALVMAASKGIGRACALALAMEGVSLTVGARSKDTLEKTAQDIRDASGIRVLAVPADVTREEDLVAIVDATIKEYGRLDILINNAGGPPVGSFSQFDDKQWISAFELTLLSAVRLFRLTIPHLRASGNGRIINIASSSVKQPIDNLLLSNAIRPGVIGLAKSLSTELAPDGITINNVCPGRILTDRLRNSSGMQQKLIQGMSEQEILAGMARDIPMGRLGTPDELASLVVFLASRQAGYITGKTTQVDGGLVRSLF